MEFRPDPIIAEALWKLPTTSVPDTVWKHTFVRQSPTTPNVRGARWNPRGVPAIYLATDRKTALAEGRYLAGQQPQAIKKDRQIHALRIDGLKNVLDLRDRRTLRALGVSETELESPDHGACQLIGGTAEWAGYDAMLVPSARAEGANLVVFERKTGETFEMSVIGSEAIEPDEGRTAPE
ncbi:MAG: RES family NAD+ phosphorylase [Chloroflexi bacterium]|nr:RES family NAD+ phosphorylase [Chloroflexota bacterium]